MRSVLVRLEGPLQAWGTQGRYSIRETDSEPSKSGVLGLVGCALGMTRDDAQQLERLRQLRMAVRVDRPGRALRDLHTVGAGTFRGRPHGMWGLRDKTVVTQRYYLVDAAFTVALAHADHGLVEQIAQALADPVWPLFLGRRSCVPSEPVLLGLVEGGPEETLLRAPLARGAANRLRVVADVAPGEVGTQRADDPVSFSSGDRHFAFRNVRENWIEVATREVEPSP
jgi:CRISPR system Cascade subunit CasD